MKEFITGYQYSSIDNKYIGEYTFPNNADKEEIHWPPFTVPNKPKIKNGYDTFWENGEWKNIKMEVKKQIVMKPDDYSLMNDWYIEELKSTGNWSKEDQKKLEEDSKKDK